MNCFRADRWCTGRTGRTGKLRGAAGHCRPLPRSALADNRAALRLWCNKLPEAFAIIHLINVAGTLRPLAP